MSKKHAIVVCSNGIIAAWHPKIPFPYEHSRPINLEQVDKERQKLFKISCEGVDKKSVEHLFNKRGPNLQDLREIFYTDKHDWLPNYTKFNIIKVSRKSSLSDVCADRTTKAIIMINALWFGRIAYENGLKIQESVVEKLRNVKNLNSHCLCFFEHFPVYTVGLRDWMYSAEEERRLKMTGASFFRVKRGGLITFHGPGQLVAYPVFNLRGLKPKAQSPKSFIGVKKFVELVEQTIIDLLTKSYNIDSVGRTNDTGVWVNKNQKIAAVGIQVTSGFTKHGLGLNCNTDLHWFENIVPCGLEGKSTTSITQQTGKAVLVEDVLEPLCKSFQSTFQLPVSLTHCVDSDHKDNNRFLKSDSFNKLFR